jgi:hypothetical protein
MAKRKGLPGILVGMLSVAGLLFLAFVATLFWLREG